MVTRVHYKEIARLARNRQVRQRMAKDARAIARMAERLAPKLSGAGAASIRAEEQDDGTWRISWDKEHDYMRYPELGTEEMSAQPFLRPAAKRLEK